MITGVIFGVPISEVGKILRVFCPMLAYKSAIFFPYDDVLGLRGWWPHKVLHTLDIVFIE
jgi:hypothetical protein